MNDANYQIRESGLDAGRPRIGVEGPGPQGQVEFQLRGEAARSVKADTLDSQVRLSFSPARGTSLRRVAIYDGDGLIAEWIRTARNEIVQTVAQTR